MPVERKRVLIPAEIEESIDYANRELARKERMPYNPGGVDPHAIKSLHTLAPYAYLHVANLPAQKLNEVTKSEAALRMYVNDEIYGRGPPYRPLIAIAALQFDLQVLQDEEKGPAVMAELKKRYYRPLHVHKVINETNTSLAGLTLRKLHAQPLTDEHCEALATLPPFSRKFLVTWLLAHERLPKTGLFGLEQEERKEVENIAKKRIARFKQEVAKGPGAVKKFAENLVLGEKALHRRALTPEQREFDRIMLRADRAHQFDAIRKLYYGYKEKKK